LIAALSRARKLMVILSSAHLGQLSLFCYCNFTKL
jgi:hypothetical protein